jgi:hypothetical protein
MTAPFPSMGRIVELTTEAGRLPPQWDGLSAQVISAEAQQRGLQFLEALVLIMTPSSVEPLPTGGRLQYRWTGKDGDLLMEVVPGRERLIFHRTTKTGIPSTKEVYGLAAGVQEVLRFLLSTPPDPTHRRRQSPPSGVHPGEPGYGHTLRF